MSWLSKNWSSAKDDVSHVSKQVTNAVDHFAGEVKKQANITSQDIKNLQSIGLKDISLNNAGNFVHHISQEAYKLNQKTWASPKLDLIKAYVATAAIGAVTGGAVIIPPKAIMKLEAAKRALTGKALGIIPKDRQEAMEIAAQIVAEAKAQRLDLDPEIIAMANGDVRLQPNYLMWGGIFIAATASTYLIIKIIKAK